MPVLSSTTMRTRDAGMTLLEALLAVLLLALCLVPAANALRGALAVPAASAQAGRDLDCVSARMETVLAEPYDRLLGAAGAIATPSAYSTPEDADCPAVAVFIARYGNDATRAMGPGAAATGNYLLYVGAELADAGAGAGYPLSTLVTR